MPPKTCPPDKIFNPATGRCVKKDGRKGKEILQNQPTPQPTPGPQPTKQCKPEEILNPATKRCVKRTGRIGQKLLKEQGQNQSPTSHPASPKKVKRVKPCKKGQVRSPKTKRCINVWGQGAERLEKRFMKRDKNNPFLKELREAREGVPKKDEKEKKYKKFVIIPTKNRNYTIKPPDLSYKRLKTPTCISRSKLELRPHQKNVVKYLEKNDAVGVFHGTGWGKTLIAVAASQCFLDKNPDKKVVIITPASLKNNMLKELKNYGVTDFSRYDISSFDGFLRKIIKDKTICKDNMVIIDEVHNIRNLKGPGKNVSTGKRDEPVRYTAAMNCMNSASKRLILTATPFINSIDDFIPIINFIHGKRVFDSYDNKLKGGFGDKVKIISDHLKNRVNYLPASELKGFPKVNEKYVNIFMTKEFEKKFIAAVSSSNYNEFGDPYKFYNGYRRAVNTAGGEESQKMGEVKKILKTGKTILYTSWLEYGTELLEDVLPKNVKFEIFSGSVSQKEKKRIVEDYNNDKVDILIITKSGAEGLDLKRTKNIIIFDPPWNESGLLQVMGRGIRNNSHIDLPEKDRVVNVYKLMLIEHKFKGKKIDLSDENFTSMSGDVTLYKIIHRKMEQNKEIIKELMKISFK